MHGAAPTWQPATPAQRPGSNAQQKLRGSSAPACSSCTFCPFFPLGSCEPAHESFTQAADAAEGGETGRAAAEPAVQEETQGCLHRGDGRFLTQLMDPPPLFIYEETNLKPRRGAAACGLCVKYYDFFCYWGGNELHLDQMLECRVSRVRTLIIMLFRIWNK